VDQVWRYGRLVEVIEVDREGLPWLGGVVREVD